MGGPWEDYAPIKAEKGPWEDYAATAMPTPEPVKKPSTIELATQGLLMGAEGDIEDARAAGQDIYRVGKEAVPIATAIGGGFIHPGLAPVGYGAGKALVKTVETARGETEAPPIGQSLKEFGEDVATAGLAQMGTEKAIVGARAAYGGAKKLVNKFRAKAPAVTEKTAERKAR